jgi:hypothetical protein
MNMLRWTLIAATLLVSQSGYATTGPSRQDPMTVFSEGSRILFQGDSNTDGDRGRNSDPKHMTVGIDQMIRECWMHGLAQPSD